MTEIKPFAYVAHRDGRTQAIIAADAPDGALLDFFRDAALSGCTLLTVYDRSEFAAALAVAPFA